MVCLQGVGHTEEELGALPGQAAILRVERDGTHFEVTVTPPIHKVVDRRILAWLADVEGSAEQANQEPIDLTDYRVNVDRVAMSIQTAQASCRSEFSLKPKPVNLAPDKGWTFTSGTASFMDVAAYSTKGDVDVAIFTGPDSDLVACDSSFRTGQSMDEAACHISACVNNSISTRLGGIVGNITKKQASYVGTYHLVFVTP